MSLEKLKIVAEQVFLGGGGFGSVAGGGGDEAGVDLACDRCFGVRYLESHRSLPGVWGRFCREEGLSMIEAGAFAEARVSLSGPEDIQRLQGLVLEAIRRQILSKSGD